MNKRDMQSMALRMLKGKAPHGIEIRDRQLASLTAAYNCFFSVSSQCIGRNVMINGHSFSNAATGSPRSCEIYDLRIGFAVNADGWIDGYIIAKTDCLYMTQDEICSARDGVSSLQVAIGCASKATFTALEDKDSFELKLVYPKVCKTKPCRAAECVSINLAGTTTADMSPNPYIKEVVSAITSIRYVDPRYDLRDGLFDGFFEPMVENGLSEPDDFTESDLYSQVLVDQNGTPVSAIVYASDHSITFDANTLALCIGTAKNFTVIAHDVGIVEVQFEHDIVCVNPITDEYAIVIYGEVEGGITQNVNLHDAVRKFRGDPQ